MDQGLAEFKKGWVGLIIATAACLLIALPASAFAASNYFPADGGAITAKSPVVSLVFSGASLDARTTTIMLGATALPVRTSATNGGSWSTGAPVLVNGVYKMSWTWTPGSLGSGQVRAWAFLPSATPTGAVSLTASIKDTAGTIADIGAWSFTLLAPTATTVGEGSNTTTIPAACADCHSYSDTGMHDNRGDDCSMCHSGADAPANGHEYPHTDDGWFDGDYVRVAERAVTLTSGSLSSDGRDVVFRSSASNLVDGDTNDATDIFKRDLSTGAITRVSTGSNGEQANGFSGIAAISANGRYVVFESGASNLVPNDDEGSDVFVKDTLTGAICCASKAPNGDVAGSYSDSYLYPSISADGRRVVFFSEASNLVPGDSNGVLDAFLYDLTSGLVQRISTSSSGAEANGPVLDARIAGDGSHVVFTSGASNLVPSDTNGYDDVFVKNVGTGVVQRVSESAAGAEADSTSVGGCASADGRYVAFVSGATNLGPDAEPGSNLFVKDMSTGSLRLVSTDSSGERQANAVFPSISISGSGRYVAFISVGQPNLVSGFGTAGMHIYRKDIVTGDLVLVSADWHDGEDTDYNTNPALSADGRYVAFISDSPRLADDGVRRLDYFVRDLGAP